MLWYGHDVLVLHVVVIASNLLQFEEAQCTLVHDVEQLDGRLVDGGGRNGARELDPYLILL